jgi:hypothetical protein
MQNVSMFKTQSPYEQQIEELKRRQQMAEMLQQQSLQPLESQVAPGGMVIPTSPLLGLAKVLEGYVGGKQLRDIDKQKGELSERSTAEAQDFLRSIAPGAQQRMSPDAALAASLSTAPTEAQPVTSHQRQEAIMGAGLSANPQMRMAAQLALMKPETEEYGTTPVQGADGNYYLVSKSGSMKPTNVSAPTLKTPDVRPVTILRDGISIVVDANTGKEIGRAPVTREPREPLEKIIGPDGKPILVPASQAVGKTPFVGAENPTQGEKQDAYNVSRIVNAVGRIQKAVGKEPSSIAPGFMEGPASIIGAEGLAQSGPRQIIAGAQADALDAMLYLATGATYTDTQLKAAKASYIPNYWDDENTKLDKQEALRNLVIEGKKRAGRGWSPEAESSFNEVFGLKNTGQSNAQVPIVSPFGDPLKEAAYQAYKRNKPGSGVLR